MTRKAILDHYNLLEINSALEVETGNLWIGTHSVCSF